MNKKSLEQSANKAVTKGRRGAVWPVYRSYEVEYEHDLPVLVAPSPSFKFAPVRDKEGRPVTNEGSPVEGFQGADFGIRRHYAPLQHPEIVLRLAEIGDSRRSGPLTLEIMQAWATAHGLLGVGDETGRAESLVDFGMAARNVARTVRLFEAATANFGEGDEEKLRNLLQADASGPLRAIRERALDEVEMNVSDALRARTYPAVYRLTNKAGRAVGFDRGDGFHDLLGACYLLLDYLIRDPAARRCNQCQQFIDPEKYSDSLYCGDACKQAAYRDRRKKQAAT